VATPLAAADLTTAAHSNLDRFLGCALARLRWGTIAGLLEAEPTELRQNRMEQSSEVHRKMYRIPSLASPELSKSQELRQIILKVTATGSSL